MAGGLVVILTLIGGLYKFTDRFATAEELQKTEQRMEQKTVQTFEVFQHRMVQDISVYKLNILKMMYEDRKKELIAAKRELLKYKDNVDLEFIANDLRIEIDELRKDIKELEDKISGASDGS